jgi:hypothetical protein
MTGQGQLLSACRVVGLFPFYRYGAARRLV